MRIYGKSMKVNKIISILIIILFLLTGCASELSDCTVIGKQYHKPYTTFMPVFNGKSTTIIPVYHPEEYVIIIEGTNDKGERRTYSVAVPAVDYIEIEVGDEWTN